MKHLLIVAVFTAAISGITATADAQDLAIDFQATSGLTEAGFQAFEEDNQVLPTGGTNYAAFGTSVSVNLDVINLPDGNLDFRTVARNGTTSAGEKENDWIGVDTRGVAAPGTDVTLVVAVSGLPAGSYSWLSTHHDGGSDATNGNLNGTADTAFTDAFGTTSIVDGVSFSEQDEMDPISTFSTLFTSDGANPVSFSMIMDNGQGGTDNALFAFINSVEISAVPEPSTFVLFGVGLAGLAMMRRRK